MLVRIELCPASTAILVRPQCTDRVLILTGLGQSNPDLVDACVLTEAEPQALEVVQAASVTECTFDDEAASAQITEPLHLWTAAIEAAANVALRDQPVTS